MQREIGDKIQLGDTLNPLNDVSAVQAVDNVSNLKDMFGKISKLGDLWEKGKADASIIRYPPGSSEVLRQGKIFNIVPKTAYASSTYTDKKTLEFTVDLAANTYTNYSMMTLVLPIYFKKSTHKNADVDIVMANNFFACWLKEIDIRRYRDDVRILPTNNIVEVCNYAGQQLKHLPTKSLDGIKETILYEEKTVVFTGNRDRRLNDTDTAADRTDANLSERVTDFHGLLKKIYYRIPLGFYVSLGLVNFPHKIDTRVLFTLETNLNELFETNAKVAAIPDNPVAQIIYHNTPYISYPQIILDDNFLAYYNGTLRSRSALRTDVVLSPYQQSFEINTRTQSLNVNFRGLNKQIEWIEISLAYDKSDQCQTIYGSYDVELAAVI